MKRKIYKFSKKILFCALAFFLILSCFSIAKFDNISHAADTISIDSSKFIYHPTHSTYVGEKIYFIDSYDGYNYFKVFSSQSSNTNYAETSLLLDFEVVDAFSIENMFFVLTGSTIKYTDLSNQTITFENLGDISLGENLYSKIFVYKSDLEFIITLTPATLTTPPLILLYSSQTREISQKVINDSHLNSNITFLATLKINETTYCYIQFGESKIKYYKTSLSEDIIPLNNLPSEINSQFLDTNPQTTIIGVNMISLTFENIVSEHFLITYKSTLGETDKYYSKIYSYDFSVENNFKFENADLPKDIQIIYSLSEYVMTNGEYMVYPNLDSNPQIIFSNISNQTINEGFIENPNPTTEEFSESSYLVKKTTNDTYLLSFPWEISSETQIAAQTDVLVVGKALIGGAEIENLYYCLYTTKNEDSTFKNNYGFIKADLVTEKAQVTLEDLKLAKTVKVYPNTSIYALPSKASDIKLESDGKFAVQIINTMDSYTTDTIEWIKVRIGTTEGYIDRNRIDFSENKVDFITPNAEITRDGTYVYSSASSSSAFIYNKSLSKGKKVFIDGIRDTKTGFTKIKFNDEYGNEFEGYVKTENLKSNTWSQLQIIGSILIAINTGILILILVFKNKKLSKTDHRTITSPDNDNEVLN